MDYNPDDLDGVALHNRHPNSSFEFPPRSSSEAMHEYTPAPLPAFSFNPGNMHASTPSTSTVTAPRPIGHRRRPSELIGGEGPPSPRLMGTSPGNTADGEKATLPPPLLSAAPRGPGRRGHAHRRSQAMSSMDLTALTLASPSTAPQTLTVGSAPTTPADNKHDFHGHMARPMSRSAIDLLPQPSPPGSPAKQLMFLRPGVAFHDKPRPVSMISTETSSSLSTVRPNHSRVSSAAPSNNNLEGSSSAETIKARPKTADASLLVSKLSKPSEHFGEMPFLRRSSVGRKSSETVDGSDAESIKEKHTSKKSKKKKQKKRKSGGKATLEEQKNRRNSLSTERTLDISQDNSAEKWESASSLNSRSGAEDSNPCKGEECHNKKQKKVRTWAGAIFPLKNKRTHVKRPLSRRSPTPPPILTRTNSNLESIEVNFDEDNTVIIRTPTNPNIPKQTTQDTEEESDKAFENAWKPRSFYEQGLENNTFSPVIDLDAALGPFNTPEMGASRIAGSAFSQATKRMYSGGRRGEFVGPEMRYHRRAESAPEMPPFDRSALIGFPRLGSDNAMANVDVFYEEEEDAFLAENQSPKVEDKDHADGEQVDAEVASVSDEESERDIAPSSSETLQAAQRPTSARELFQDDGLGIRVTDDAAVDDGPGDAVIEDEAVKESNRATSQHQVQNKMSVEIIEAEQWAQPRVPHHANSPDISPTMVAIEKRPCSSPLDLNSGLSQLTLPSRHASSSAFPSPDPSNMSFDGPRSATASSMTDHTTFNHSLHDQRQSSFEDVPSLSSSASTRTNPRGRFSSSFYLHSLSDRRESFNALPPRSSHSNSAKRSSLVSLSRLVGGSYGEKSKLSHEEKPPADEAEKTRRKSNRVSRLMFWKSKDKQSDS
ncbi:cell wall proline rich protein, putative [Talaromyces stipitatus ATCC 10500]|uniref:Cell wall proline rich protein, putative n=1 Tax=Talaromyces stipitatus (strain ATCC 10500 / CBS 375.48 / QM 6759 / NRRL 1006) TaxID=441959 RepID=B8M245_TALSN|nr:cell wall proline rich protein, putative [Talaromyces stipitatus ATCC 10500]EED21509.1 cell wall proline rich protein, putative [Talaromyces stipitatus ATCC 10500]